MIDDERDARLAAELDDLDGLCNDREITLSSTNLVRGQTAVLTASHLQPGVTVGFLRGTAATGGSWCLPGTQVCGTVASPVLLGTAVANAAGEATFSLPIPANTPVGARAVFQALWSTGAPPIGEASAAVSRTVR